MKCILVHKKTQHTWNLVMDTYEDDEEKAFEDLLHFAESKFHLKDIKVFKMDDKAPIEDADDLFNELEDVSRAHFLVDGTPTAAMTDAGYTVSINLSQCGVGGAGDNDHELSLNICKCDFKNEEGWNNVWQDLCNDIGNELKNDTWENKNELVDVKNNVPINKLSQFINVFKNVKNSQNEEVHLAVKVELTCVLFLFLFCFLCFDFVYCCCCFSLFFLFFLFFWRGA